MALRLTSTAFRPEGTIPDQYAKNGNNISPPLAWDGVPDRTESLVLVMDDPDAPSGLFTHWLVYGMNAAIPGLHEKQPAGPELPNGGRQGLNGFGDLGYGGPQLPHGTHRYVFHLYALETDTHLPAGLTRQEIYGAIEGHILEEATLMGRYTSRDGSA
jgi:Raf kinase inhibitor-like YbhB/YbcL family protein